jgi:PhoPQ-activated pathogenicity-related protein
MERRALDNRLAPVGRRAAEGVARTTALGLTGAALVAIALGLAPAFGSEGDEAAQTALDRYVAKPDDAFRFERKSVLPGGGYEAHVLELVSQRWRNAWEVDRTEWHHWLTIIVPSRVRHRTALLWIGGGQNGDPPPSRAAERSVRLAVSTGTVVADLAMVPNQPLFFADSEKQGRSEDDLIAYGRIKYLVTRDVEWLVRLAMVKSGVRAMDAVQQYLRSSDGGGITVENFVVAGGSKRGWTTWLVGAIDTRVEAIVPVVIDALNSEAITRHHYEAYGFFSPALGDYVRHGLYPYLLGTDGLKRILAVEDPFLYRDRDRLRTIPKLLVNAAGDQFFLPDNSRFYFADLSGEKHLRYVPNAKHDLAGSDAQETILAFYRDVLEGRPRPRFTWRTLEDETIVVSAQDRPHEVLLWQATNPSARDFRLDVIGKAWSSTRLEESAPGEWHASVPEPASGFTAYFVELTYEGGRPLEPLKLTTTVSVVPNRLPFKLDIDGHTGPWLGER